MKIAPVQFRVTRVNENYIFMKLAVEKINYNNEKAIIVIVIFRSESSFEKMTAKYFMDVTTARLP